MDMEMFVEEEQEEKKEIAQAFFFLLLLFLYDDELSSPKYWYKTKRNKYINNRKWSSKKKSFSNISVSRLFLPWCFSKGEKKTKKNFSLKHLEKISSSDRNNNLGEQLDK